MTKNTQHTESKEKGCCEKCRGEKFMIDLVVAPPVWGITACKSSDCPCHTPQPSFEEWKDRVLQEFLKYPIWTNAGQWLLIKLDEAHERGKKEGVAEEKKRILAALPFAPATGNSFFNEAVAYTLQAIKTIINSEEV